MSPFFFVLVAEVLNKMVSKARSEGLIERLLVGKSKVDISHPQFVDDTILFCPAKHSVVKNYKYILDCFGIMLGLTINYEK